MECCTKEVLNHKSLMMAAIAKNHEAIRFVSEALRYERTSLGRHCICICFVVFDLLFDLRDHVPSLQRRQGNHDGRVQ